VVVRFVLVLVIGLALAVPRADFQEAPRVLPAPATRALEASLKAAAPHTHHVWRDTPSLNADGTVNAYVEIGRGDRRKWEFDMAAHAPAVDRVIAEDIGGYPVNYGFVPQTVSYDGDPFDALVLGPPLASGRLVRGVAVGVMFMEDEKGLDSKIVLSLVDEKGQARHTLSSPIQDEIAGYFRTYKRYDPGGFSRVPGWGSAAEGLAYVRVANRFFRICRDRAGASCVL
jgi:inorganic pyrophosphatase